MFKTIVVGTDGSETADRALARAFELAKASGGVLHIVSAYSPSPARVSGGGETAALAARGDFKVEAVLERAGFEARTQDVQIESHAPKGDPADALLEVAGRVAADLIVVGSRGMQGARRVLGSVPNKISHHAACDVLIVHTTASA